jgi:hydrogenase-4 component F
MGLVCIGLALGPAGIFAACLHIVNHAIAKSMSFVVSGRILQRYRTTEIASVTGLCRAMPLTGVLFAVAVLALIGLPPFGLFVSEVMIFAAGFGEGHPWLTGVALALLVVGFAGLLRAAHRMLVGGTPAMAPARGSWVGALPIVAALAALAVTGLAWPPGFANALALAAKAVSP